MKGQVIAIILVIILAIGFSLGAWFLGRKVNYGCMYKGFVKETIRETVKENCLREK